MDFLVFSIIKTLHLIFVCLFVGSGAAFITSLLVASKNLRNEKYAGSAELVGFFKKFCTTSFIMVFIFGIGLLFYVDFSISKWLHYKFFAIFLLAIIHAMCVNKSRKLLASIASKNSTTINAALKGAGKDNYYKTLLFLWIIISAITIFLAQYKPM